MNTSDVIAFGSFFVAALALYVALKSQNVARDANRLASLDRKYLVVHGVVQTAKIASTETIDAAVLRFFHSHTLLARQFGFHDASISYIRDFREKLERLKLLQAFDENARTEEENKEMQDLKHWFFLQQAHAIGVFDEDIRIEHA